MGTPRYPFALFDGAKTLFAFRYYASVDQFVFVVVNEDEILRLFALLVLISAFAPRETNN